MPNHSNKMKTLALMAALVTPTVIGANSPFAYAQEQQGEIEFAADDLRYDPDTGEVIAVGNVLLSKDGFKLRAAEVRYNEGTGIVTARGDVRMIAPSGEELIAPEIIVTNELRDAFIADVRLIMKDGAQVAARSAERDGVAGTTILDRAVYSPCKVCEDKKGKKPIWQIKAVKVTHDEETRRLKYKNAYLEFLGLPIFWVPYFSHPDSPVERASGLLPIEISQRKGLGVVVAAPYHFVIDKSKDLTLTPILPTSEEPVLAGEFRQHFGYGQLQINASGTYTGVKNYDTGITGPKEFRGHFFGKANFSHGENWRSTFRANVTTDDTYLRLYGFSDDDTLVSEAKMEGFFDRTYVRARFMGFQGLRQEDINAFTPFVMPEIFVEHVPSYKPLDGTVYARFHGISVTRPYGMSTQRASASLNWQRHKILSNGLVLESEALIRGDIYNIEDTMLPDDPLFAGVDGTHSRFLAQLSTQLSLPMIKFSESGSNTLEPIIELSVSPESETALNLSNEDSRAFELNNINLFDSSRASGLDIWEGGTRVTYGLKWTRESKGLDFDVMIGQSWRTRSGNHRFLEGSGLEDKVSDFVGRTNVRVNNWFTAHHRFRLDKDNLRIKRNEADVTLGTDKAWVNFGYLRLNRDLNFINREDREELRVNSFYRINQNWSVKTSAIGNLTSGVNGVEYAFGVNYLDECFDFGVTVQKRYTRDRDIVPGSSIMLRLKLKNLG